VRGKPNLTEQKLMGYRLATAEILYWMPDHPSLLQSFVWQHYDLAPGFPELHRFLNFWKDNIEATLHSVKVAGADIARPGNFRPVDAVLNLT